MRVNGSTPDRRDFHAPGSAEQLTEQNVRAIAQLERAAQKQQSMADRVADLITRFCGSVASVWLHAIFFGGWIWANTIGLEKPVDPFPFAFLTLVVSLEAIFLSTFILISGNRKARVDERRSHLDLQIDLLTEQENTKMLCLLKEIAEKLDIDTSKDPSVSLLEQATCPDRLAKQIDRSVGEVSRG